MKNQKIPKPQIPKSQAQNQKFEIQNWLWNSIRVGFMLLTVVIIGLVVAVANGVADPQPVGSLQWEDQWTVENEKWTVFGAGVRIGEGLEVEVMEEEAEEEEIVNSR